MFNLTVPSLTTLKGEVIENIVGKEKKRKLLSRQYFLLYQNSFSKTISAKLATFKLSSTNAFNLDKFYSFLKSGKKLNLYQTTKT